MAKASQAEAFGGGDYADDPEPGGMEDEDMSGDTDLPPDFEAAYDEYDSNPSAQTFWAAVEACTAAPKGGGLALLIGKGKK
jgi:hypothetical protein